MQIYNVKLYLTSIKSIISESKNTATDKLHSTEKKKL